MGLNPPPAPPSIFTVAIPEETVTVEIPAPLKSMRVTPVPTVPDAVAIPTPAEETVTPPIVNEVAVTTPTLTVVAVTPPTVNEVAVITPTLKSLGGEILVENPARLDALDILLLLFSYLSGINPCPNLKIQIQLKKIVCSIVR
jgi:hypothetical protein